MSAKTDNQFDGIIRETLRYNLETMLEKLSGFYCIANAPRDTTCGFETHDEGFTGQIPIVLGFSSDISTHCDRKVSLLWKSLFDEADISNLTNEKWKAAFRSFREATTSITLTQEAWRDCQLLPLKSLRQSFLPPMVFPEKKPVRGRILLVDHGADESSINDAINLLVSEGFETVVWSRSQCSRHPHADRDNGSDDIFAPAVHLHLGSHSIYELPIRIVDSWNNRRCVIQYINPRSEKGLNRDDTCIESGVNGILARSMDELLFALHTIEQDDALRERIISLSILRARQLSRQWQSETKAMLE